MQARYRGFFALSLAVVTRLKSLVETCSDPRWEEIPCLWTAGGEMGIAGGLTASTCQNTCVRVVSFGIALFSHVCDDTVLLASSAWMLRMLSMEPFVKKNTGRLQLHWWIWNAVTRCRRTDRGTDGSQRLDPYYHCERRHGDSGIGQQPQQ